MDDHDDVMERKFYKVLKTYHDSSGGMRDHVAEYVKYGNKLVP